MPCHVERQQRPKQLLWLLIAPDEMPPPHLNDTLVIRQDVLQIHHTRLKPNRLLWHVAIILSEQPSRDPELWASASLPCSAVMPANEASCVDII